MSRPLAFGGTSGGGINTLREFLGFMAQLRTERSDFRPDLEWDEGSVQSSYSWSASGSHSENAVADSVESDNTAYSPLSLDTASQGSNYSSFDEMFSPNYYSAEESEYDLSDADVMSTGIVSLEEVFSIDEVTSLEDVAAVEEVVTVEDTPLDASGVDVADDMLDGDQCEDCARRDAAVLNKRERSPSPNRPMKRRLSSSDGDAARCSICMDAWASSGEHRVVALACGHVFGYGCIRKWLLGKMSHYRRCPTCKMRASLYDIRYLRPTLVPAPEAGELRRQLHSAAAERDSITDALCRSYKHRDELEGKVRELKAKLGVT